MKIAEDNRSYFAKYDLDINDWVRQYRQVDERIRLSLNNPMERMSEAIKQVFQQQVPVLMEGLRDVCEPGVEQRISQLKSSLVDDVAQLLKTTSNELVNHRLTELNDKVVTAFAALSEDTKALQAASNKLTAHHDRFANAKSNADRGNMGEEEYADAMDKHFTTAEIIENRRMAGCSDFEIHQEARAPVLIEVKHYEKGKVDKKAVGRFLEDIRTNQKHGVMVSIHTGITRRKHFEFESVDGRFIAIYVCKAGFDMGLLETALEIVHSMDNHIKQFTSDEVIRLRPAQLADICDRLNRHFCRVKELQKSIQQSERICKDLLTVEHITKELQFVSHLPTR